MGWPEDNASVRRVIDGELNPLVDLGAAERTLEATDQSQPPQRKMEMAPGPRRGLARGVTFDLGRPHTETVTLGYVDSYDVESRATKPGWWFVHCHNLLHTAGMMMAVPTRGGGMIESLAHGAGLNDEIMIFLFPVIVGVGAWVLTRPPFKPDDQHPTAIQRMGALDVDGPAASGRQH